MAEPQEVLPPASPLTSRLPDAPTPPLGDAAEQPYRSLSVLALVGFGMSALYAAICLLLALVALLSRKPMPALDWTLLIPVSGLVICLVARFRIALSEGTLAGGVLTGWGLVLSLLVCTAYGAYYFAVYLALKQQSEAYVSEWFDLLRQGQTARAVWRAMPPRERAGIREEDPDLRRKLEQRVAADSRTPRPAGSPGVGGQLTHFLRQDVVRAISTGGLETTIVPNGVKSLEAKPLGGYRVVLSYHISTPDCWFDAQVAVESTEGEGPQWNIDMSGTALDGRMELTESGKAMTDLIRLSRGFVDKWQGLNAGEGMRDPSGIAVHLLTLPEGPERNLAGVHLRQWPSLGAVVGGVASSQGHPEIVAAFQRTCRGGCVEVASDALLDATTRKRVLDCLRSYFPPGPREHRNLVFNPGTNHPTREFKGDKIRLGFDTTLEDKDNFFKADLRLILEADAAALRRAKPTVSPHWRFIGLKLVAAEAAPLGPPPR